MSSGVASAAATSVLEVGHTVAHHSTLGLSNLLDRDVAGAVTA